MKRQRLKDTFRNDNKCIYTGDSDNEETELFIKKSNFKITNTSTIDKIIEEGDTLQALSIRYHCTVAELKRLNHIDKDNEIFARNKIKVPAKPFSVALAGVHTSGESSPNDKSLPVESKVDLKLLQTQLENSLSSLTSNTPSIVNEVIFNSKVCDIQSNLINEDVAFIDEEEEVTLLPNVNNPRDETENISWLSCNGADGDISWIALFLCIIVICIVIPFIYVLYIAEHPSDVLKHTVKSEHLHHI